MPAARNEVTQRLKPPKVTTFCSTPQRHGHIGTVADGCKRLRTQKQRRANTSQPPDPQSKTRTLGYAFGKKITIKIHPGSLAKRCPKISGPAPSVPLLWRTAELKADQHCDRWAELRSLQAFSSALSIVSSVPGREKVRWETQPATPQTFNYFWPTLGLVK